MLVLGIETSCDETALALVRDGKEIVAQALSSSLDLHKEFGGIVPEIANRHHLEYIIEGLEKIRKFMDLDLKEIELIAVTYGPGLVGSLLIGLSCAKALSLCLNIDLIGVNHLGAHLYASSLIQKKIDFPFIGLVISGGHTVLVKADDYLNFRLLRETKDVGVGEAFDKVAKILDLGYPGGPVIDKLSKGIQSRDCVKFTRPFLKKDSLDFSFSGIKTAVLYYIRELSSRRKITKKDKVKIAAGFQEAVVDVLIEKAIYACKKTAIKNLVVGGGVSANTLLRKKLSLRAKEELIKVIFPPPNLCVDNAIMVAGYGYQLYKLGQRSDLTLKAQSVLNFRG
jgi:N6-L-threonylcarbamoyladenine synthase